MPLVVVPLFAEDQFINARRVAAFGDPAPPHRWRAVKLARAIGSVFQNPEHQFVTARVADELAVGLRRIGDVVVKADRPEIRGMVQAVRHLVTVEEVD